MPRSSGLYQGKKKMQGVGGLSEQPWRVWLWAGLLVTNKSPHPGLTASTPAPDWEAPAAEAQVPACIQRGSAQVTLRTSLPASLL